MGNAESSSSELNPTSSYGRRRESKKSAEEEEDNESRSVSSSLMAGAAIAGTALLAFGAWKLATSSSSSDAPSNRYSYRSEGTRTVKFMTYNLWIQEISLEMRIKAIGQLIEKHSPDVIMLQEVTPKMIKIFRNSEWLMDYKYKLPQILRADRGSFCIMMSNMPVEAELIELDELDESKCCVASINVMGRTLHLATCHLKSNDAPKISSRDMRRNQADGLLHKLAPCGNVVIGGDMNWKEDLIEDLPSLWGCLD